MKNNSLKPGSKVTSGTPALQEDIIRRIQEIMRQPFPWATKRKLVKQALDTLSQIYQANLEAIKEVELRDTLLKKERSRETPIPRNTLEAEMAYFEKHMEELLKLYEGKYVAIKGEEVVCVKDSEDDIVKETYTKGAMLKGKFVKGSEVGSVLIRKVTKEPSEEFIFTTKAWTRYG